MTDINPGDLVRLTGTFANDAGALTDPSTITVSVRLRKRGATSASFVFGTDAEVVQDSTGVFHIDYLVPDIAPDRGLSIEYEWAGTGAVQSVEQGAFVVGDRFGA